TPLSVYVVDATAAAGMTVETAATANRATRRRTRCIGSPSHTPMRRRRGYCGESRRSMRVVAAGWRRSGLHARPAQRRPRCRIAVARRRSRAEEVICDDVRVQVRARRPVPCFGALGVQDNARESSQGLVHENAAEGWRLVQIFAPGIAAFGAAKYYELIFERERGEAVVPGRGRSREA